MRSWGVRSRCNEGGTRPAPLYANPSRASFFHLVSSLPAGVLVADLDRQVRVHEYGRLSRTSCCRITMLSREREFQISVRRALRPELFQLDSLHGVGALMGTAWTSGSSTAPAASAEEASQERAGR